MQATPATSMTRAEAPRASRAASPLTYTPFFTPHSISPTALALLPAFCTLHAHLRPEAADVLPDPQPHPQRSQLLQGYLAHKKEPPPRRAATGP